MIKEKPIGKEGYTRVGVVAFIFSTEGRILTIRELKQKEETGCNPGQYSVLCETSEDDELPIATLLRGVKEELGYAGEFEYLCYQGLHEFISGIGAHVYVLQVREEFPFSPHPDFINEVEIAGWYDLEEFEKLNLRAGVRNILNKAYKEGILSIRIRTELNGSS